MSAVRIGETARHAPKTRLTVAITNEMGACGSDQQVTRATRVGHDQA